MELCGQAHTGRAMRLIGLPKSYCSPKNYAVYIEYLEEI